MKTEYNGIEIAYSEQGDEWLFELRGRSRRADSLAKAKEAIDKEPVEKRKQTFPRFQAYHWRYDGLREVTVTSIAEERGYGGGAVFWVTDGERRSKESESSLFPVNEHNTKIIDDIKAIEKEKEALDKKKSSLHERLQKVEKPKEIA